MPKFPSRLLWMACLTGALAGCQSNAWQPAPPPHLSRTQQAAMLLGVPQHHVRHNTDGGVAAASEPTQRQAKSLGGGRKKVAGQTPNQRSMPNATSSRPQAKRAASSQLAWVESKPRGSTVGKTHPLHDAAAEVPPNRLRWTREALINVYQTHNAHDMGFELSLNADGRMVIWVPDGEQTARYTGRWTFTNHRIVLSYETNGTPRTLVYVVDEQLKPADLSGRADCRGSMGLRPVSAVRRGSPGDYRVWPRAAVQAGLAPCPR